MVFTIIPSANVSYSLITGIPTEHKGIINNIVLFVSFADTAFEKDLAYYERAFNSMGCPSLKHYFNEVSYGQLEIHSIFPGQSGNIIVPYIDPYPISYYHIMTDLTPGGDGPSNNSEQNERFDLLKANTIKHFQSFIEQYSLDFNYDNDDYIDSVTIIFSGESLYWDIALMGISSLLIPHAFDLDIGGYGIEIQNTNKIKGMFIAEKFYDSAATGEVAESLFINILHHEMYHVLGAPDMYCGIEYDQYLYTLELMSSGRGHMTAYSKHRYGSWMDIPVVSESGTYTLEPLAISPNSALRIDSPGSNHEYFIVEYRKRVGFYESLLLGEGLVVFRINPRRLANRYFPRQEYRNGEYVIALISQYSPYEHGIMSADVGFTRMGRAPDPMVAFACGTFAGITVSEVGYIGDTISFRVDIEDTAAMPVIEIKRERLNYSEVTITTATDGAAIHYTTDGSEPTIASPVYIGPISVPHIATIRAFAVKEGLLDSGIIEKVPTRDYSVQTLNPMASHSSGFVYNNTLVSLYADSDATIIYTTDGSDPNIFGATYLGQYREPILITEDTVIKAQARTNYTISEISTFTYIVGSTPDNSYLVPDVRNLGHYIDLENETLLLAGGYNIAAYSIRAGRWIAGKPDLSKLLNRNMTLAVTDSFDPSRKSLPPGVIAVNFPPIEKRPKANTNRLVANYAILPDTTGTTPGAWTLSQRRGSAAMTGGIQIAATTDRRNPSSEWAAISEEGIPVLPFGTARETFLARSVPSVEGGKFIPASRIFRLRPAVQRKATNVRPNLKNETIRLRAGMNIRIGDTQHTAASRENFSLRPFLDAGGGQTVQIWMSPTDRRTATGVQEFTLVPRAGV
jgi:M6 family metalloprotease-like protein